MKRMENEDFKDYKRKRAEMNLETKVKLKGTWFWVKGTYKKSMEA